MMERDRTDYITFTVVAALATVLAFLLAGQAGERARAGRAVKGGQAAEADGERLSLERLLGHYPPVPADREKVAAFTRENHTHSRALFLLGEFDYLDGSLEGAVENFRRALELNRGYADAKSPLYRGELLKRVADEGLRVYQRERALRPEDENVKRVIKDLYFIRRSLAGGCD